ncbi:transcription initiation factor TFIID subunit 3-like isoform X2 [Belonocnema kinseyi]|uniref:transcription initiation factor TFIID subunit 3-like isoform X2 n=1 Tax=Belonocnema kinseyi TaxID=2817044 RepID=UPI00143CEAE3|nr:transcription initiation factor TFIID subunit 3-like isoform X2 [Belonocnema kinseyi]
MTSEYSRSVLRVVVAQICQTIGWHSINSSPLEFLVDLMHEYLLRVSKLTHQYSEVLGRTEANLDDLGLAFRHMNISIEELAEYVKNVDSIPCPVSVPKLPIHRESHLNFLKPGSREVVTRPVHVHEHLPAMYPETEEYASEKPEILVNGLCDSPNSNGMPSGSSEHQSPNGSNAQGVFKRPVDPVSFESPITKRPKLTEEGRPLREIHSVMMTTSGFLSPAREGKLPEARTPQQARSDSPPPSSYPMVPPELKTDKKPKKVVKKTPEGRKLDKENKKKNRAKELFKPDEVKKLTGMKELAKLKALKPGGGKAPGPSNRPGTPKLAQTKTSPKVKSTQPKVKPDKVVEVPNNVAIVEKKDENVDKVASEPDKRKLNIFKKISKTDKELEQVKQKVSDSWEASPPVIVDDEDRQAQKVDVEINREERKTPHTPDVVPPDGGDADDFQSPGSNVYMFDNMSPPGTPKTPDVALPVPVEPKKKKKERVNKKKEPKVKIPKGATPKKVKMPIVPIDLEIVERPKTPQAPDPPPIREQPNIPPVLPFPFYPFAAPGPGLIPHPMGLPMFPRFPLPLPKGVPGPHPGLPNLPIPPRFLNPSMKPEDYSMSKPKFVDREKPILPPFMEIPPIVKPEKVEKVEKEKMVKVKPEKEVPVPIPSPVVLPPVMNIPPVIPPLSLPIAPSVPIKQLKTEKLEKNDKKSKEHKKEKKDKIKKKKDKKEKHKEKGEKIKEKKEKGEKKEKLEKLKEKKEKREKRKEKDLNKKTVKEEKAAVPLEVGVPKLTLKLGTSSPRPPTPDSAPMKKITIKPLLKKPEEEAAKRESSPELAKISALVTRPPKQKTPSKKTEEGILELNPTLSSDSSFSTNISSVSPRAKRSLFKPPPSPIYSYSSSPSPPLPQEQPAFYYVDASGNQVWICPACGKQDDGSPMIGCDDCDAWYHWVCVGMQVPPAPNEDWYCRQCLTKKQELHHDKKKKKRKKKVKVPA